MLPSQGIPSQHGMTTLEQLTERIDYCEEQMLTADSMAERAHWDNQMTQAEAAWEDEASKHVSQDAKDYVPQVMTVRYV